MEVFIDSASITEIEKWLRMGDIDGVTTNPSVMFKDGVYDAESGARKIAALVDPHPLSVEVTTNDLGEMINQATAFACPHIKDLPHQLLRTLASHQVSPSHVLNIGEVTGLVPVFVDHWGFASLRPLKKLGYHTGSPTFSLLSRLIDTHIAQANCLQAVNLTEGRGQMFPG